MVSVWLLLLPFVDHLHRSNTCSATKYSFPVAIKFSNRSFPKQLSFKCSLVIRLTSIFTGFCVTYRFWFISFIFRISLFGFEEKWKRKKSWFIQLYSCVVFSWIIQSLIEFYVQRNHLFIRFSFFHFLSIFLY